MRRATIYIILALLALFCSAIPASAMTPQIAAQAIPTVQLMAGQPVLTASGLAAPPAPASALTLHTAADATVDAVSSVTLSHNQTEFQIVFSVKPEVAHAGAEFALQCPAGVAIKSVSYGGAFGSRSSAGPTEARGLIWFTYFSGKNDFSGEVTATVTFTYTGKDNTAVVLDHVEVFTKSGEVVSTQTAGDRRTIPIYRSGAGNDIPQIEPPQDGGQPDSENTPDGVNNALGGSGAGDRQNSSGSLTGSAHAQSGTPSGSGANEANTNGGSANSAAENPGNELTDPAAPLSPVKTDIQSEGQSPWLMILVVLLAISILANLTLGYFLIKRRHITQ
jgi:hypothetical protein